jgi:hypothetical protein
MSNKQKLVAVKQAAAATHYHQWSNYGQRYDGHGMKVMLYECTICLKEREVLDLES